MKPAHLPVLILTTFALAGCLERTDVPIHAASAESSALRAAAPRGQQQAPAVIHASLFRPLPGASSGNGGIHLIPNARPGKGMARPRQQPENHGVNKEAPAKRKADGRVTPADV